MILAGVITALVVALLGVGLLRRAPAGVHEDTEMQVYRDQLSEIGRDQTRGVIDKPEAERLRLEVSRRLLAADKAVKAAGNPAASPGFALGVAVFLIGGAYLVYDRVGAANYPDLALATRLEMAAETHATRPTQAEVEVTVPSQSIEAQADPSHMELMVKLRSALQSRPDDLEGHVLLAQNEAALGNFMAAHLAQESVVRIKADNATADDFAAYGDLLVLSAGGYVSPKAEAAFQRANVMDPENGTARYYLGLMQAQTGRPDLAFATWRILLESSRPDAPWNTPIRAQIEDAAVDAGIRYTLPEGLREPVGPSEDDIEAAQEMTDEERREMIWNMVNGLSDRLATEGGTASDWARLIGALGVLEDVDQARVIWTEAQRVFASNPAGLAEINAAAANAGLNR